MPGMLGKSSHHENNLVSASSSEFFNNKKISPIPLPISYQKHPPSPFGPISERMLSLFQTASLNSLAGDNVFHGIKESLMDFDLSYITEGQDDLVMYCLQSLAHYGGSFGKEKKRGGDIFF